MALVPLKITAHMLRGVSADPFSLDMAGILASQIRARSKSLRKLSSQDEFDIELPLARCNESSDDWHWLTTCAEAKPLDDKYPYDSRTYYKQVDAGKTQTLVDVTPQYSHRNGAYRDVMLPTQVLPTPTLTWYAVGDKEKIEDLLLTVRSLGRRRNKGEGKVLYWEVVEAEGDSWSWGHVGGGGVLLRPVPADCAVKLGVGFELEWRALRPPSWEPSLLRELAVPAADEAYFPEDWEF